MCVYIHTDILAHPTQMTAKIVYQTEESVSSPHFGAGSASHPNPTNSPLKRPDYYPTQISSFLSSGEVIFQTPVISPGVLVQTPSLEVWQEHPISL